MRPKLLWNDPGLPPRREDDVKATVYSMAFNPSGTELVVAVANLVLVYATEDGDLRHRLRGHKDLVYTVSYGREGSKFASGGADNTVIIWNSKGEGILKYTHSESIQVRARRSVVWRRLHFIQTTRFHESGFFVEFESLCITSGPRAELTRRSLHRSSRTIPPVIN